MEVHCDLFGPLREAIGTKSTVIVLEDDATVRDVLDRLVEQAPTLEAHVFDEEGGLGSVNVTRNRTHVNHESGLETAVEDGDVIRIALPVVGGSSTLVE